MIQTVNISRLGLSRKISDKCSRKDPIDEITKFDSTKKFLLDVYERIFEVADDKERSSIKWRMSECAKKDDNSDVSRFGSECGIASNGAGNINLKFRDSWGPKKFDTTIQYTVNDFPGYSYATFYVFTYNGAICVTHCHDMYINIDNEKDGIVFDHSQDVGTSIIISNIYKILKDIGVEKLKEISAIITRKHNPTSGTQGFWNTRNNKIYTYRSDDWYWLEKDHHNAIKDDDAPEFVNCEFGGSRKYYLEEIQEIETNKNS